MGERGEKGMAASEDFRGTHYKVEEKQSKEVGGGRRINDAAELPCQSIT
jgi:hypothetical protein